jgi:hypothetical protein
MKVKIPFKARFKESLLNDTKTWTSRTKRYGKKGDTFDAFGHEFEILGVEKRALWDIADNHYKEEGCESTIDFMKVWSKLHQRKGWHPYQRVFVHVFRRITLKCPKCGEEVPDDEDSNYTYCLDCDLVILK